MILEVTVDHFRASKARGLLILGFLPILYYFGASVHSRCVGFYDTPTGVYFH
jgi:hypothetical protein